MILLLGFLSKLSHVEPKAQRIILLGIHNDGFGAGSWELAELI